MVETSIWCVCSKCVSREICAGVGLCKFEWMCVCVVWWGRGGALSGGEVHVVAVGHEAALLLQTVQHLPHLACRHRVPGGHDLQQQRLGPTSAVAGQPVRWAADLHPPALNFLHSHPP